MVGRREANSLLGNGLVQNRRTVKLNTYLHLHRSSHPINPVYVYEIGYPNHPDKNR
jgi:hypothetical protein